MAKRRYVFGLCAAGFAALAALSALGGEVTPCSACAEWNLPQEPFRIFGNTYYVGTRGLSAILVTSDSGHVLIDGGLSESAPRIAAGIRALGFRTQRRRAGVRRPARSARR